MKRHFTGLTDKHQRCIKQYQWASLFSKRPSTLTPENRGVLMTKWAFLTPEPGGLWNHLTKNTRFHALLSIKSQLYVSFNLCCPTPPVSTMSDPENSSIQINGRTMTLTGVKLKKRKTFLVECNPKSGGWGPYLQRLVRPRLPFTALPGRGLR